jgi:DNA end-binding protein Ku
MARPVWSGAISFGLVAIPVKLYNAVQHKSVRFNQLDERSMARIKLKKVSAATGEDVPDEHIVKGYEISKGSYVVVDPDELEEFIPRATHSIDLEEFVALDEIDPVFFDAPYIVGPDGNTKPYALLARAMEQSGKVAIGRFVMRNKQYVAAVRASNGILMMNTMAFADEVVSTKSIEGLSDLADIEVSDREVAMAESLVESLTANFDPSKFQDTHREQLLALIERKASGEQFEAPAAIDRAPAVIDLMAALEASVQAAKEARTRHPSATDPVASSTAKKAAAKKAPAKKAAAKKAAPAKAAATKVAAKAEQPKRLKKSA